MKKLEFIIKSEHLDDLKTILANCNATDIIISNIKDYNNEKGIRKSLEVQNILLIFCAE